MGSQDNRPVVVADDDEAIRLLCRVNLELEGYRVLEAASADDLEELVAAEPVALVLLDVHLGHDDGLKAARRLRRAHPEVPLVVLSGSSQLRAGSEAFDGAIRKPFTLEELTETVRRLARR
jgi:DNA-binding response OmpR family regulator